MRYGKAAKTAFFMVDGFRNGGMVTILKHEIKNCPRCNVEFECKAGSILLCQCQTIFLTTEQTDFVSARFDDCLCVACLQELRSEYNTRQHRLKLRKFGH